MSLLLAILVAAISPADAIKTVLNSRDATSPARYEIAVKSVYRDAANGKPLQQFIVGVTTDDAKLAKRYLDESRDAIRKLAETKNNPLAWYLLSMEKNDYGLLKRAADGGNVQAMNALGTIITQEAFKMKQSETNRIAKLLQRSYGYYRAAALQRDPNGFVNLGTCYLHGLGCKRDLRLAFECYLSAAKAGHPAAMDYVSASYEYGNGVKKDSEMSLYWRMRGEAVRGNQAAAEWLKGGVK